MFKVFLFNCSFVWKIPSKARLVATFYRPLGEGTLLLEILGTAKVMSNEFKDNKNGWFGMIYTFHAYFSSFPGRSFPWLPPRYEAIPNDLCCNLGQAIS